MMMMMMVTSHQDLEDFDPQSLQMLHRLWYPEDSDMCSRGTPAIARPPFSGVRFMRRLSMPKDVS
eukprot:3370788-Karenia_brevis.AAC.1